MKRFILEQSKDEFYTAHSGLALIGLCINKYSDMAKKLSRTVGYCHGTSLAYVLRSYSGLL